MTRLLPHRMSKATAKSNQPQKKLNASLLLSLAPVAVFLAIALTLIVIDHNKGRAYFDHTHFHLPVIEGLIKDFDISDYKAATAPGYHLIFASIGQVTGLNITLFKLINALITAVFIAYLCSKLGERFRPIQALLIVLPMVLSVYILPAGVWLLPDNLAWLTVAWLMFQINSSPFTNKQLVYIAIVLALAVFIRQTYLWLTAIVWASGLSVLIEQFKTKPFTNKNGPIAIYPLKCILCTIPAFIVIAYLGITWGGLVPPSFQSIHHHISPSTPAFFFALFAVYTTFYIPIFIRQTRHKITKESILIGAFIGFISVIFIASTYDMKAGRFGGLWNIIKLAPTIGDKSLLMIFLSTLGGVVFTTLIQLLDKKARLILVIASTAFVSAMTVNQFVYERYFSGYIFIVLILLLSQHKITEDYKQIKSDYWLYGGVIAFALFNMLILYRSLNQNF